MHTPDVPTSGHPPQSARPDAWEADGVLRAPLPRAPVPPSGEGPAPPTGTRRGGDWSEARPLCSLSGGEMPRGRRGPGGANPPNRPPPGVTASVSGSPPRHLRAGDARSRARPKRGLYFPRGINILTTKCAQKPRGQPSSSLLLKILQGVAALKDRGGSCASEALSGAGFRQPRELPAPGRDGRPPGAAARFQPACTRCVRTGRRQRLAL